MKKIIVTVIIALALLSCAVDPPPPDVPDQLPVLGFASISPRIILPVGTDVNEMMYFLMAPQITSFLPNQSGLGQGRSYTQVMFGSTVTVSITKGDNGFWDFNGTYDDGWFKVEYNPTLKVFNYEQFVYIRDENDILGGSGSDKGTSTITWTKGSNINISVDGKFHGLVDFNVFGCNFMGESDYSNSLLYGEMELYRGILDNSDVGTGYRTSQVNMVVDDNDLPVGRPAVGIIDDKKFIEYHTYLSTLNLDPATGPGTGIGRTIGYRYDDGRELTNSQSTVSSYFLEQGNATYQDLVDDTPAVWLTQVLITE